MEGGREESFALMDLFIDINAQHCQKQKLPELLYSSLRHQNQALRNSLKANDPQFQKNVSKIRS